MLVWWSWDSFSIIGSWIHSVFFGGSSKEWIRIFFIFTPIWGNDPFWLIFFKWVETHQPVNVSRLSYLTFIWLIVGVPFPQTWDCRKKNSTLPNSFTIDRNLPNVVWWWTVWFDIFVVRTLGFPNTKTCGGMTFGPAKKTYKNSQNQPTKTLSSYDWKTTGGKGEFADSSFSQLRHVYPSLKLTSSRPWKWAATQKGNDRIPTIHFQGRLLLVSGGVNALEFCFFAFDDL